MQQVIQQVSVKELKDAPRNKKIHQRFDANGRDAWLVDDIRDRGVVLPLLVRPDMVIEDGHRRKAAALASGRDYVPVLVTDDNVFMSAQLGRNMTLYAKVVLYRESLEKLVDWGNASKGRAKQGLPPDPAVDDAWIEVEEVLAAKRDTLRRGLKLLQQLEKLGEDNPAKAAKIDAVFRDRGLFPALRVFGEKPPKPTDDEPDCTHWDEDDAPVAVPRTKSAPKGRKSSDDVGKNNPGKKPEPAANTKGQPAPVEVEEEPEDWRDELRMHVESIEQILDDNDQLDAAAQSHLLGLRNLAEAA